jgi:hypothetical protein
MNQQDFEEQFNAFWDGCDSWAAQRLSEISAQGPLLSEGDVSAIEEQVEEDITTFCEKAIALHGESFSPRILTDLHHLFFEMELKKRGVKNEEHIHRYKDNGLLGISVTQGKVNPDNALLLMEVNRAHLEKKGGNEEAACENCICGKNEDMEE